MFRSIPKRKALVVGLVFTLAIAGAAFAYWTTTGSGSGSGSVASANGTLVLHGTITDQLTPGGSSSVTFTADNSNSTSLEVGTIHAVVSIDAGHSGCSAADFHIADTAQNQVIAAGATGVPLDDDGLITMDDTAVNQDACKGASISLALSS